MQYQATPEPDGPAGFVALVAVHQIQPARSLCVCLTMAPSVVSERNQRKLAPNYRLLSVKNGTGAHGVCHHAGAAWLTHCGTWA